MNFSLNFRINPRKIIDYLLIPQDKSDKSQFLNQYGYTQQNWQQLEQDILASTQQAEIIDLIPSGWGLRLKLRHQWQTPHQKTIQIIAIWQVDQSNQNANFVTLYPNKSKENRA